MLCWDIKTALPGMALVITADQTYAKPKLDWLLGDYAEWFKAYRWKLGLDKWQRRHDCDDFARAYAQGCSDAWALTEEGKSEGLAVGEFFYHSVNGPHAIVCAFTPEGRVFIEPQTCKLLNLSDKEINSCWYARF